MASELASYTEIAEVLDHLPLLLREARRARQITIRDAATQAGLAYSTFNAIELGHNISLPVVLAAIRWLDRETPLAASRRPSRCGPNCTCSHAAEEYR